MPIHQYQRGAIIDVNDPVVHRYSAVPDPFYVLDEAGEFFDVPLYVVPDLKRVRAMLEATALRASAHATEADQAMAFVTPWVALASGFRDYHRDEPFDENWDYGVRAVRDMAFVLRHFGLPTFPPDWRPVEIRTIGLYPAPFSRLTPHWTRHFIEYARAYTQ